MAARHLSVDAVARVERALRAAHPTHPAGLTADELVVATRLPAPAVDLALAALVEAQMARVHRLSMGYVPTLRAVHEAEVSAKHTTPDRSIAA